MYLSGPPTGTVTPFFFAPWPWYLPILEVIALAMFFAVLSPFLVTRRRPSRASAGLPRETGDRAFSRHRGGARPTTRAFSAIIQMALVNASTRRQWLKPTRTICAAIHRGASAGRRKPGSVGPAIARQRGLGQECVGDVSAHRQLGAAAVGPARSAQQIYCGNTPAGGRMDRRATRSDVARTTVAAARRAAAESEYRSAVEPVARAGVALKKNRSTPPSKTLPRADSDALSGGSKQAGSTRKD